MVKEHRLLVELLLLLADIITGREESTGRVDGSKASVRVGRSRESSGRGADQSRVSTRPHSAGGHGAAKQLSVRRSEAMASGPLIDFELRPSSHILGGGGGSFAHISLQDWSHQNFLQDGKQTELNIITVTEQTTC